MYINKHTQVKIHAAFKRIISHMPFMDGTCFWGRMPTIFGFQGNTKLKRGEKHLTLIYSPSLRKITS